MRLGRVSFGLGGKRGTFMSCGVPSSRKLSMMRKAKQVGSELQYSVMNHEDAYRIGSIYCPCSHEANCG